MLLRELVARVLGFLYQKAEIKKEIDHHQTTKKPWGKYIILSRGDGYKIKRLVIKPGQTISLQMHRLRSEHWVVVNGTATVQIGEEIRLVKAGESVFVKVGEKHRVMNRGAVQLEIIEVQLGTVDESDIVRFEDSYGRVAYENGQPAPLNTSKV